MRTNDLHSRNDPSEKLGATHPAGQPSLMRLAGSGMELATYTLAMGAGGYAIDYFLGHSLPGVAIAGALVGFVLGMYRLILLATRSP